jgi:hypothetical protein
VTVTEMPDPTELSLEELRGLRQQLQLEDDAVSYARRVAQARLDLLKSEAAHRSEASDTEPTAELRSVLSQHLTGGPARPPRPTADLSDHPLAVELDDAELAELTEAIATFESRVSSDRRQRFDRLDALSAELVRRYRVGEADVDTLYGDT